MSERQEFWRPPPKRIYEARDPSLTSSIMSKVRGRDNKAEILLRHALWSRGLRYRVHSSKVVGRPDLLFATPRVVVFVDGEYWHGRGLIEDGEEAFRQTMRTPNREWWITKLKGNIARDQMVNSALEADGWLVLRYWEREVLSDVQEIADLIETQVRMRQRSTRSSV